MHSWIGLYALLKILRTAGTEDFSRANLKALINASGPIDMLGLTTDWTPNTNNPGTFPRTGNGHYAFWAWDPKASLRAGQAATSCSPARSTSTISCAAKRTGRPRRTC